MPACLLPLMYAAKTLHFVARAELLTLALQAASAGTARALDRAGALAELVSHRGRYLVKRSAVTLGRTTSTHGKVGRLSLCKAALRRPLPQTAIWLASGVAETDVKFSFASGPHQASCN